MSSFASKLIPPGIFENLDDKQKIELGELIKKKGFAVGITTFLAKYFSGKPGNQGNPGKQGSVNVGIKFTFPKDSLNKKFLEEAIQLAKETLSSKEVQAILPGDVKGELNEKLNNETIDSIMDTVDETELEKIKDAVIEAEKKVVNDAENPEDDGTGGEEEGGNENKDKNLEGGNENKDKNPEGVVEEDENKDPEGDDAVVEKIKSEETTQTDNPVADDAAEAPQTAVEAPPTTTQVVTSSDEALGGKRRRRNKTRRPKKGKKARKTRKKANRKTKHKNRKSTNQKSKRSRK